MNRKQYKAATFGLHYGSSAKHLGEVTVAQLINIPCTEVERLKRENDFRHHLINVACKRRDAYKDEVMSLQRENERLADSAKGTGKLRYEIKALQEEIKHLRGLADYYRNLYNESSKKVRNLMEGSNKYAQLKELLK